MNALQAVIETALEISLLGLAAAIDAAGYAALFAGVVLVVDLVSRRWLSAAQKNVLWGLVLVRLLMPWAPPSWLSVQNLSVPSLASSAPQKVADWLPATEQIESWRGEAAGAAPRPQAEPIQPSDTWRWDDYVFLAVWIAWVLGFSLVVAGTAVGYVRFLRRLRKAPACQDRRLVELWQSCRELAGVRRPIAIVHCDAFRQPALMGFWRPRLLLPDDIAGLDDEQLRMIMLHELAHVRRHDVAINWLMVLVRAMQWWNPVYWLAASRFASLREQACDAFVIRRMAGERKRVYSELLLLLAQREAAGSGWRVCVPVSILGFLSSYFRQQAVGQRLRALRLAGTQSGRARTAIAAVAIALVAACGLTDAMPPADKRAMLDWVPAITLNSIARQAEDGPLVTRSYDLSGLLDRIAADSTSTPDAAADLTWLIEMVLQIIRPGVDDNGSPPAPSGAAYTLDGAKLEVAAPESLQDKLADQLKIWQQSGLGQICVECRFMTADHDIARGLGVSWQIEESRSLDTPPILSSRRPAAAPVVRAGASVVEDFPVMVASLSKRQAAALVHAGLGQPGGNSVQSPKVTAFNGTRVAIGDRTQTPFVVGIQKDSAGVEEPIIRILEEGTTLTFRPIHSGDRRQVRLEGRLEFSKIGDVYETRANLMFGGEPATVQVPCAKRWRIDFDSTVNEGESVLIGFVPTYQQKVIVYALLTVQTVVPDAAVAAN